MNAPAVHTAAGLLREAAALGLSHHDARYLLCHLLQVDRAWLIAHDGDALPEGRAAATREALQRLAGGEPLAYLVGEREFHGLTLKVAPGVLIPRPDTEVLVDWALECLQTLAAPPAPQVLDLGTGSGAIALAVAHRHPAAQVQATDLSPEALRQAQANAQRLGLPVRFRQGAWWAGVEPGAQFDLVLSNPPYIAGGDPHLEALRHEPTLALTPGGDGLDDLRRIVSGARAHLKPGAWLLLEHGYDQAPAVQALLDGQGFEAVQTRQDLGGQPRCTGGRQPAHRPPACTG